VVAVPEAFATSLSVIVMVDLAFAKKLSPALPLKVTVKILPVESVAAVHVTDLGYVVKVVHASVTAVCEAVKMAVDAVMVALSVPPTAAVCGTNVTARLVGVLVALEGVTTPLIQAEVVAASKTVYP